MGDVQTEYRTEETLRAFSRRKNVDLLETAVELITVRAEKKLADAERDKVYAQLKAHYARGSTMVRSASETLVLKMSTPGPGKTKRAVVSTNIERLRPSAWQASRVIKPKVLAIPPSAMKMPEPRTPVVLRCGVTDPLDVLVREYKRFPAIEAVAALKAREEAAVCRLREIAEQITWDGLPLVFGDGWNIRLSQYMFDGEVFREKFPDLWERYAVEKTSTSSPRLTISRAGESKGDEYAE